MDLERFVEVAQEVCDYPEEWPSFARIAVVYLRLLSTGRDSITRDDVEPQDIEVLLQLGTPNNRGGYTFPALDPKKQRGWDAATMDLPTWLPRSAWASWCADRKARRQPITKRAAALHLNKLEEYIRQGHDAKSVIEHSIASGYRGLFPPPRFDKSPRAAGFEGVL